MTEEFTKLQKKTKYDLAQTVKKENFLFINENYCKKGQTVLLGDSITELFNSYEFFYDFAQKSGQAVYNRGISGDTSDRLLERLKSNALNLEPRNLVLLIGTNDLGVCLPQEFIVENIRETLKMTRTLCPNTNIVLQAVYPVNRHINLSARQMVGKRRNEDIAALNTVLREIAAQYNAFWLDLTEILADKKGGLSKEYTFDGLHLNAQGFAVAAKKIIPCLK
ncbi:MAG: GDSL-type esterase/lipase family protein [Candidatus Fimenecus sp.]